LIRTGVLLAFSLACAVPGCKRAAQAAEDGGGAPAPQPPEATGTPVKVAKVERANLAVTVSGPGRTDALEQQKIRAPFKGILRELRVADGDHVRKGKVVAVLVSQESQAALTGAEALLRSARTPEERSDAERAVELARSGLVPAYLRAPEAGVVVAHGADEGSLVAEAQDIVSMAASASFVFRADIVQTDLPRIRPGQPAEVRLAAGAARLAGKVHAVLPAASATDLIAPVRIDFESGALPEALALFGTAAITVGARPGVPVVPAAALLRDDVSGVTQVAVVSEGKVHWVQVTTGVVQGGRVEIVAPPLEPGTVVVVQGQVGLPEGAQVAVQP
jgi:multidrug efflux pump subunit AcrA (membrane-fusion protein)